MLGPGASVAKRRATKELARLLEATTLRSAGLAAPYVDARQRTVRSSAAGVASSSSYASSRGQSERVPDDIEREPRPWTDSKPKYAES
jgi:hypothetical protein